MSRYVDLGAAVDDYEGMRKQVGVGRAELRSELRPLNRLLAANGRIWVHDVGQVHLERAFESGPNEGEQVALDLFFEWCRRRKWLGRRTDALPHRSSAVRVPDPARGMSSGECSICKRRVFVDAVTVSVNDGEPLRMSLCMRCQSKPWPRIIAEATRSPIENL